MNVVPWTTSSWPDMVDTYIQAKNSPEAAGSRKVARKPARLASTLPSRVQRRGEATKEAKALATANPVGTHSRITKAQLKARHPAWQTKQRTKAKKLGGQ